MRAARFRLTLAGAVVVVTVVAGCASSKDDAKSEPAPASSEELGVGVTADEIKIGVVAPEFECIKGYTNELRKDQKAVWQYFVDAINADPINGRKVVMDFNEVCPKDNRPGLALCTRLTEDSKVFAVLGTYVDFTGRIHDCVTKQHQRVLLSYLVTKDFIDKAPPGLLISPQISKERRVQIILDLLKRENSLSGKKVGILAETVTNSAVKSTVDPGLDDLGVERGSTAIFTISGEDTASAQSQLDSFIEKWKDEGTNAIFMVGEQVSHKQFVEKVRGAMPDVMLISDNAGVADPGQDFVAAGTTPNPYEGVITAEGDTGIEHTKQDTWKYCKDIYEKATGETAPDSQTIIDAGDGRTYDQYSLIEDACTLTTLFADIARKAGPTLNNTAWTNAVNTFGKIRVMDSRYGSLGAGKYDADDTFGLVAFDSSVGSKGDWRRVTEVQDVGPEPPTTETTTGD